MARVMREIQNAESDLALERGLKWFLILPKAVFREGKRGGKAGRGLINQRMNCLVRGDWSSLLDLLVKDVRQINQEDRRRMGAKKTNEDAKKEKEKKKAVALSLLAKGQIRKAVRRMTSHGVADIRDPVVKEQLKTKYPDRGRPLPDYLPKGRCVDSLVGLKEALLELEAGTSSGTGGLRPEYLICLAEVWDASQMRTLQEFGVRYLNGDLPPWWYRVWLSLLSVALYKTIDQTTVRPLGIHPCLSQSFSSAGRQAKQAGDQGVPGA